MVEKPIEEIDVTSILGSPYNVVLYNDDSHACDEVQAQVVKATGCSMERAYKIMNEAHTNGRAIAYTGGKERCELVESILAEIKLMTKIEQA
jgi:ATP-dependent Clp protease adapter protein ClpS